ncbi:MAG: hypothetical protein QM772_10675 [Ottowia sp.]|uniref:hypothetical protein n=1 Tax=Ottowia sp. TaxID=1898956 RepID=UPI0039E24CBC
MARPSFVRGALALAVLAAAGLSQAATLRIVGANDILTFDPHAQNHQTTRAYQRMVDEGLVRYNEKLEVSAYLPGWGVATFDALYSLIGTVDPQGGAAGNFNSGRMSDPKGDGLIQQIKTEMDARKRDAMIHEALQTAKDNYNYLPLHDQIRPWAMRKGVTTVHRADDRPAAIWATIK